MRVPIRSLKPPSIVVRPVDPDGIDMVLLKDSIRKMDGLIVPVTVTPDGVIVDGYRRWLIGKGLGWDEIDVHEVEGDPDELRIIAQTREVPFGRDEKRALLGDFLQRDRSATAGALAHKFQWSVSEVESLAGVQYLIQDYRVAYESGAITLSEVWQLSRIRNEAQLQLLTEESDEPLYQRAAAFHREERAARRRSMVGRPRGKTYNALLRELETPCEAGLQLIKADAKTPMDGWNACLKWVLSPGK